MPRFTFRDNIDASSNAAAKAQLEGASYDWSVISGQDDRGYFLIVDTGYKSLVQTVAAVVGSASEQTQVDAL